ncbi:MAG: GtrA family protein [Patescibacteria group bacterium]|nr:GtrA family protein [Patescibacteria group bacterium]
MKTLDSIRCWLRRPTAGQFLRFSTVGVANTFVDFGVYIALTRPFPFWAQHLLTANVISFTIAATSSFLANTFWTFRCGGDGWQKRFPKFFMVAIGGMLLNSAVLGSLTWLGVYDLLAKAVATAIVLTWNFGMQKKWTFKM